MREGREEGGREGGREEGPTSTSSIASVVVEQDVVSC